MYVVEDNVQHNDIQNNIIDVSNKSDQSVSNNRNEIAMDDGPIAINNDENECDHSRKEGETTVVSELDDIDIVKV